MADRVCALARTALEGGELLAADGLMAMLATVKAHCGDLDRVKRVLRLFGMCNCTPDFAQQPQVTVLYTWTTGPCRCAYVDALPPGLASPDDVVTGARVMAVYTALTRLDWALARVADGEGALAGKFRHPSVAPYIHAMQRQAGHIEALLA